MKRWAGIVPVGFLFLASGIGGVGSSYLHLAHWYRTPPGWEMWGYAAAAVTDALIIVCMLAGMLPISSARKGDLTLIGAVALSFSVYANVRWGLGGIDPVTWASATSTEALLLGFDAVVGAASAPIFGAIALHYGAHVCRDMIESARELEPDVQPQRKSLPFEQIHVQQPVQVLTAWTKDTLRQAVLNGEFRDVATVAALAQEIGVSHSTLSREWGITSTPHGLTVKDA